MSAMSTMVSPNVSQLGAKLKTRDAIGFTSMTRSLDLLRCIGGASHLSLPTSLLFLLRLFSV